MKLSHIFLAIIVTAIWGCNFIFIKLGVHEISPLFLCALRFLLASIPIIFLIKLPKEHFRQIIWYGLIMFTLQFSLMFMSFAAGMTAGMASLLVQTQIFFSILFAVFFLKEKPTIWQILGGLVAFSGIIFIAFHVDHEITKAGVSLIIGAAIAWGIGNLITKKITKINLPALIAWGSFIASIPLFGLSMMLDGPEKIMYSLDHVSWLGIISLLYIVYASTWIGYGAWNFLISQYPISLIVPFTLLVPIFGMLSSAFFLGENLSSWKLIASSLVISGLVINLLGPRFYRSRGLQNSAQNRNC